jgi:hypothetical protein
MHPAEVPDWGEPRFSVREGTTVAVATNERKLVAEGNIFDRELPNGNVLQPCHWVFLYLHDFPEIEGGLIAFLTRSKEAQEDYKRLSPPAYRRRTKA